MNNSQGARSPPLQTAHETNKNVSNIIQSKRKDQKMRILFINNLGAGFADHINVIDGITVEQFFADKMHGCKENDYLIRVNRQPVRSGCNLIFGLM